MHKKYKILNINGFTLPELLIAAAVLALTLCGVLYSFVSCFILNETNRKFSQAYNVIQIKMEEIKNIAFDSLDALNGTNFDLSGFSAGTAGGRITVTDEDEGEPSNLKRIEIFACFMCRSRLIGSPSIDNCTSSPVELVTLIAKIE